MQGSFMWKQLSKIVLMAVECPHSWFMHLLVIAKVVIA